MKNKYVNFISDEHFLNCIGNLHNSYLKLKFSHMKYIYKIILLLIFLNSCGTSSYTYYQVYSTKYDNLKKNDEFLEFENEFCLIKYKLWSNGGNPSFLIYNKSEKNLIVNLEDSYFIKNGISYNYFKNRVYTQIKTSGITSNNLTNGNNYFVSSNSSTISGVNNSRTNSVGTSYNQGYSVSYTEEKLVTVPPKSAKYFSEYIVNDLILRDCDLNRFPNKKDDINILKFTKENSPFNFSNRISLKQEGNMMFNVVQNDFYINEVTNIPSKELIQYKYNVNCGVKDQFMSSSFKTTSPDKFYIVYSSTNSQGYIDNRKK